MLIIVFVPRQEKGVTVIHSQDHPLNDTYSLSFRQRLESSFKARGVEFVFNDAVEFPAEPGTVTTKKGAEITADLVVRFSYVPSNVSAPCSLLYCIRLIPEVHHRAHPT